MTPEREKEIRGFDCGYGWCQDGRDELLAEIDKIRSDAKDDKEFNDKFIHSQANEYLKLRQECDQLKSENEKLQTFYDTYVDSHLDPRIDSLIQNRDSAFTIATKVLDINASLRIRIEKLREVMCRECSCPGEENIKCDLCNTLAEDRELAFK